MRLFFICSIIFTYSIVAYSNPNGNNINKNCFIIDAKNKDINRVVNTATDYLRGKNDDINYSPRNGLVNTVFIINAQQIKKNTTRNMLRRPFEVSYKTRQLDNKDIIFQEIKQTVFIKKHHEMLLQHLKIFKGSESIQGKECEKVLVK